MTGRKRRLSLIAGMLLASLSLSVSADIPLGERRSGYAELSRETQAMQDDDTANPAMLTVLDGEALWNTKTGAAARSCADCHGEARISMKGVAARHPAFDTSSGRPVNLEQRINICQTQNQQVRPSTYESKDLLALSAFVALQSRGQPIAPPDDPRLAPHRDAGRATYFRRQGQLNLGCNHCHDDNWGKRLGGNLIPQGHSNAYPIYRLEWQSVGSLQRRLRNCMTGLRAEPYALGAPENVDLELYLMWRARGMTMESPGVRP